MHASSPGGVRGGCTGSALAKGALNPSWGMTPPTSRPGDCQKGEDPPPNTCGNHLVVTSNGIARFALNAANAQRSDAKLATAAWGVIVVEAGEARLEAWNLRAPT